MSAVGSSRQMFSFFGIIRALYSFYCQVIATVKLKIQELPGFVALGLLESLHLQ